MEDKLLNEGDLAKYIGQKIQYYRKQNKMTQQELADKVGVSFTTISNYETGYRTPRQNTLFIIADLFNISVEDLYPLTNQDRLNKISNLSPAETINRIPLVGTIACGDPILSEENIEKYIVFPQELTPSGRIYFLKAQGDSMEPTINDGDLILVRQQSQVENGEIAVCLFNDDNEATLKRLKINNNQFYLVADNSKYPPRLLNQSDNVRIIGKAITRISELS